MGSGIDRGFKRMHPALLGTFASMYGWLNGFANINYLWPIILEVENPHSELLAFSRNLDYGYSSFIVMGINKVCCKEINNNYSNCSVFIVTTKM